MVDFDGLVKLIDKIGGVDVKVQQTLIDPSMHITKKGLKLKAGERTLDGKTALSYARSRHSAATTTAPSTNGGNHSPRRWTRSATRGWSHSRPSSSWSGRTS